MDKYCRNCGNKLKDDYKACPKCGTFIVKNNNNNNYFSISGFIISIVSSLLCCGIFNLVSLSLCIAGLVTSNTYKNGKGYAIAGIIISILPMIMILIIIILLILGVVDYAIPISGYQI